MPVFPSRTDFRYVRFHATAGRCCLGSIEKNDPRPPGHHTRVSLCLQCPGLTDGSGIT